MSNELKRIFCDETDDERQTKKLKPAAFHLGERYVPLMKMAELYPQIKTAMEFISANPEEIERMKKNMIDRKYDVTLKVLNKFDRVFILAVYYLMQKESVKLAKQWDDLSFEVRLESLVYEDLSETHVYVKGCFLTLEMYVIFSVLQHKVDTGNVSFASYVEEWFYYCCPDQPIDGDTEEAVATRDPSAGCLCDVKEDCDPYQLYVPIHANTY